MTIQYQCPDCGSTMLQVDCVTTLRLRQTKTGEPYMQLPDFKPIEQAFWDDESTAQCRDCESWGFVKNFKIEE